MKLARRSDMPKTSLNFVEEPFEFSWSYLEMWCASVHIRVCPHADD